MNLNNLKINFNPKGFLQAVPDFLIRKNKWLLFAIALLATGYCCYIWYVFIYNSDWSNERKEAYVQSKNSGIVLNKNKYQRVMEDIEERHSTFEEKISVSKDIFK